MSPTVDALLALASESWVNHESCHLRTSMMVVKVVGNAILDEYQFSFSRYRRNDDSVMKGKRWYETILPTRCEQFSVLHISNRGQALRKPHRFSRTKRQSVQSGVWLCFFCCISLHGARFTHIGVSRDLLEIIPEKHEYLVKNISLCDIRIMYPKRDFLLLVH